MSKKKSGFLLTLLFILSLPSHFIYSEDIKPFKSRFSLKLTAGWGSALPMGDVNDCLDSFNNNKVFKEHRDYKTGLVEGEIRTLDDRFFHAEAELLFDLTSSISLGIATSPPIRKNNESSLTYTILGWAGPQITTWTFRPEIKISFPIRLSAYYKFSFIPRLNISLGGGTGFYFAKISQLLRIDQIPPSGNPAWYTWDQKAKRNFSLGFHGNTCLEYLLTNRLALVAEFQYIHSKIKGFTGSFKLETIYGDKHEMSGTLYYFASWDSSIAATYSSIEIHKTQPEGGCRYFEDIRKAALNLNGYSFKFGVKVRLF